LSVGARNRSWTRYPFAIPTSPVISSREVRLNKGKTHDNHGLHQAQLRAVQCDVSRAGRQRHRLRDSGPLQGPCSARGRQGARLPAGAGRRHRRGPLVGFPPGQDRRTRKAPRARLEERARTRRSRRLSTRSPSCPPQPKSTRLRRIRPPESLCFCLEMNIPINKKHPRGRGVFWHLFV